MTQPMRNLNGRLRQTAVIFIFVLASLGISLSNAQAANRQLNFTVLTSATYPGGGAVQVIYDHGGGSISTEICSTGTCTYSVADQTHVDFIASGANGSVVHSWSGVDAPGVTLINPTEIGNGVFMDRDRNCSVTFYGPVTLTMFVSAAQTGTITATLDDLRGANLPGGYNPSTMTCSTASCTGNYLYTGDFSVANITFSEQPTAPNVFKNWNNSCSSSYRNPSCGPVLMDRDKTVSAYYAAPQNVNLAKAASSTATGTIEAYDLIGGAFQKIEECGVGCTAKTVVYPSSTVNNAKFKAVPASDSYFYQWDAGCTNSTNPDCGPLKTDRTLNITARFYRKYSLAVTKDLKNSAQGTVVSSPSGINCGVDCTALFGSRTPPVVTLTMTPDSASNSSKSFLVRWGSNETTLSSAYTMDHDQTVTAYLDTVSVDLKAKDASGQSSDGPVRLSYGQNAVFSWSTLNADSCTASSTVAGSAFTGSQPTSGTFTETAFKKQGTYTLTCQRTASNTTVTDSVTVDATNTSPSMTSPQQVTINEDAPLQQVTLSGIRYGENTATGNGENQTTKITATSSNMTLIPDALVITPQTHATQNSTAVLKFTPASNQSGESTITLTLDDQTGESNSITTQTFKIVVTAVNDIPTASAQTLTTNEDSALSITLAGSDMENSPLTYSTVAAPAKGVLSGSAPNLTYTPTLNATGADSFTFKANDGSADSAPATISITITPVNDAPVATPQSLSVASYRNLSVTLAATDVDSSIFTFRVSTQPQHGTLTGTAPNLVYKSANGYVGTDSFRFIANDGALDSAAGLVSIQVTPAPPNNLPTISINPTSVSVNEDDSVGIQITAADADGDSLSTSITSQVQHGVLTGQMPNYTYAPSANYNGADSFIVQTDDGIDAPVSKTVAITVNSVNDAPVLDAIGNQTVKEAASLTFSLSATDVDNDSLTYSVDSSLPAGASFNAQTKTFTWTPGISDVGDHQVNFKVEDNGTPNLSDTETITITVEAINHAPVVNDQTFSVSEDSAVATLVGTVAASDVNTGDTLTYSITSGNTGNMFAINSATGAITLAGALNYETVPSYSLGVSVSDNGGPPMSDTATITINVGAVAFNYTLDDPTPNAVSVLPGSSGTATATVKKLTRATEFVDLSIDTATILPDGAGIAFADGNSCKPSDPEDSCEVVLTVTTTSATPAGIYPITLKGVSRDTSLEKTVNFNLVVSALPLTASCSVSPNQVVVNNTVTWTAAPAGGSAPYTYTWEDVGGSGSKLDGETGKTSDQTYIAAGTKTAKVTVTSEDGQTITSDTCSLEVIENLTVNCSGTRATGNSSTIQWTAQASGGDSSYTYSWSGDADGQTIKDPLMQYGDLSAKTAQVTVTSAGLSAMSAPCSVTESVEFAATPAADTCGAIQLTWHNFPKETGSRSYKVLRHDISSSNFVEIPGSPITPSGTEVTINDGDLMPEGVYFYQLKEDEDILGTSSAAASNICHYCQDIGLRVREANDTVGICVEPLSITSTSKLRISRNGVSRGIILVDPDTDPHASNVRVRIGGQVKALKKFDLA